MYCFILLLFVLFCTTAQTISFIIEYRQEDYLVIQHYINAQQYQVHHIFNSTLLYGMSFSLKDNRQTVSHPAIQKIYPVSEIPRPQWRSDNQTTTIPFVNKDTQIYDVYRELNITGQGILIGVLDSGIDYHHTAFGQKIKVGKNLVPPSTDLKFGLTPLGEDDPFDPCTTGDAGHGTHVAGIIAGYDPEKNFRGIAPDASLGIYRIFSCAGGATEDTVIKAMEMAYKAGCKIINLSLGVENGWSEDAMAVVAERLSNEGVIVIGVAGNQGEKDVVAAASIENSFYLTDVINLNIFEKESFFYVKSSNTTTFPDGILAPVLNNQTALTGCQNENIHSLDNIKGNIMLVQRGHCTFDEKLATAKKVGATGLLYYDPDTSAQSIVFAKTSNDSLPCAGIEFTLAQRIIEYFKHNTKPVHVVFPMDPQVIFPNIAGQISRFSSTGPSYELELKPTITGIGGGVYSTLPLHISDGWGIRSGTSMAAPHVSGTIALLIDYYSKRGMNVTSTYIMEQLQNHAKVIKSTKDIPEHPVIQGAGFIQPLDAIHSKLHVSPAHISFNDTASLTEYKTHRLQLTNTYSRTIAVSLDNMPSQSIQPYANLSSFTPLEPVMRNGSITVNLEFSTPKITIPSGSTATVDVKVILPTALSHYHYHMYGGYIAIKHNLDDYSTTVPYFGVLGNMTDLPVFDKGFPYLTSSTNATIRPTDPQATFHYYRSTKSRPTIVVRLLSGCARLEVKLYDAKQRSFVGDITGSPWTYNQRNTLANEKYSSAIEWDGKISGQTHPVADGTYFFHIRALKHFGHTDNLKHWEEWTSAAIVVNNKKELFII
ncbi:hypothetical protein CU098_011139 [Rhizopus stolonifer]|uniref:Peptidase S8/S53 domain-containing protein n=1 Tax=Rhizopus stolonifer TaxID=4846 RepID=A0A367KTG1_RHIST|nr:hypothetical protein CU098_011139 [Rhizopus stolonifer]